MISAHRDIRMHLFLMVAAVFMGGAALEATAQRVTDQKMLDAVRNIGIKNGRIETITDQKLTGKDTVD